MTKLLIRTGNDFHWYRISRNGHAILDLRLGTRGVDRAAPGALLNLVPPEQNTKLYRSYVLSEDATAVLHTSTLSKGASLRQPARVTKV